MPSLQLRLPTVALVFMALWVLGAVSSLTLGGGLHILLFVAIGLMMPRIIRGRRAAD
jgi:hypothetical protein